MKPFSTYPEDHEAIIELCFDVEKATDPEEFTSAAYKLADLVKAILTDEIVDEAFKAEGL